MRLPAVCHAIWLLAFSPGYELIVLVGHGGRTVVIRQGQNRQRTSVHVVAPGAAYRIVQL
jgi:hypothetical protein